MYLTCPTLLRLEETAIMSVSDVLFIRVNHLKQDFTTTTYCGTKIKSEAGHLCVTDFTNIPCNT
jgi:hypothetical protein